MPRGQITGTPALVVGVVFFLIVGASGALGIWWSLGRLALAREVGSFIPVEATVLEVGSTASGGGRGGGSRSYHPRVRYEYHVSDRRYESQEYGVSPPSYPSSQGVEQAMAASGIAPGATIEVFHDPARPARAVISREVRPGSLDWLWVVTAAGGLFAAVAAWCLVALATSPKFRAMIRGGR